MKDSKSKTASFQFKHFKVAHDQCAMKVGTDGILLGAWTGVGSAKKILDIGTGSGLLALMMAQRSNAIIHAVEIEQEAFFQAKENFRQSPWCQRMSVFHDSIQNYALSIESKYDLVICNPPFFDSGLPSADLKRAGARHTLTMRFEDLLLAVSRLMSESGRFCLILPWPEKERFENLSGRYALFCTKMMKVSPKPGSAPNRILLQFEKHEKQGIFEKMTIRKADGQYGEDFRRLTKDFYLEF